LLEFVLDGVSKKSSMPAAQVKSSPDASSTAQGKKNSSSASGLANPVPGFFRRVVGERLALPSNINGSNYGPNGVCEMLYYL